MKSQWYSKLPIAQKLRIMLMVGGASAIAVFGAVYVYYGAYTLRQNLFSETENAANLLGSRNVAAIRFQNPEAAYKNLTANTDPSYKETCLYNAQGEIFAKHPTRTHCPTIGPLWNGAFQEIAAWQDGKLIILRNILADGEIVGAIRIVRTEEAITDYVVAQLKTMAVIALVCVLFFFVIANYLQKLISRPIVEIAHDAQSIVGLQNFEGRLHLRYQDELGQVAEAFNKVMAIMENRFVELSHKHQNVSRAYTATLDRMEQMAEEFLDTAGAFLVYSEMTTQRMFGPKVEQYLKYQTDVVEALGTYHVKLASLQQIAQVYKQAIEEPKIALDLREFLTHFGDTLKNLPIVGIERHGQLVDIINGPQVLVHKLAWDEAFKILSNLFYTFSGIVDFSAKLKFDLPPNSTQLIITFGQQEKASNDNILNLCKPGQLYEECSYIKNSIEDPEAADEFLDEEILERPQLHYVLDSIAYIAAANAITVQHSFMPREFKLSLELSGVLYASATPMMVQ